MKQLNFSEEKLIEEIKRLNFNFPYLSKSIQEFWRRWHITLSFWFRDYLYIPLGGNRKTIIRNIFNLIFKTLPEDKNFYSYLFTGGGTKIKNFQTYFRSKFGQDIQILEPPSSSGIPRVLNDSSFMSVYCAYWLQSHKSFRKRRIFLKKIDSFSNKIWYKRFVDLL